ncbi:DegT/DnrJ/EryC1/StrS family aminotransferase [Polaribacter septentrionalilitoris]|uniref:DegT/DnrJ/EryC1/StrS family aminotransferase n=1 Tax=Polaribacter septentrionalilitoris TaxID=2494657 RepID=UPI001357FFBA|nr:DegT/DnrJ/EryC1/StrS family aminotransferase [Polaribacter septentrionalilitoris]
MSKVSTKIPLINNSLEFSTQFSFDNTNIESFESSVENYLGDHSFFTALNSGTSAIHLALILLGVKANDEVICQSFTFAASAYPILYQKAIPVFVGSELETWNMCPELLREAITHRIQHHKKPKAIIVVHTYGMPAKMKEIMAISQEFEIPVLEDAAGAFGAIYDGKKCGTIGDFGVFSFNNNKIITTYGGGGLVCRKKYKKNRALFYATQAKEKESYYEHSKIGYNYRMSPVAAAIGQQELNNLEKKIREKKKINTYYSELFDAVDGVELQKASGNEFQSNFWLSSLVVHQDKCGFSNTVLKNHLSKYNIASRYLWKPLHVQTIFKKCLYFGNKIAEELFKKGISLPSGAIQKNELERISTSIQKLL